VCIELFGRAQAQPSGGIAPDTRAPASASPGGVRRRWAAPGAEGLLDQRVADVAPWASGPRCSCATLRQSACQRPARWSTKGRSRGETRPVGGGCTRGWFRGGSGVATSRRMVRRCMPSMPSSSIRPSRHSIVSSIMPGSDGILAAAVTRNASRTIPSNRHLQAIPVGAAAVAVLVSAAACGLVGSGAKTTPNLLAATNTAATPGCPPTTAGRSPKGTVRRETASITVADGPYTSEPAPSSTSTTGTPTPSARGDLIPPPPQNQVPIDVAAPLASGTPCVPPVPRPSPQESPPARD
jgi:hypothetical protein